MSRLARLIILGIALASFIIVQAPGHAVAGEVEVLHWWTSGGEAAALSLLKKDLEQKGITWKDMPVAGGGGGNAMTVLRARVAAGTAPTAVQMLGFDILDWAKQGVVANLNDMAAQENWDMLIPAALKNFSKYDDKWIAAPVNVHSTNWVWANKKIFDELKLAVPQTWDEMMAAAEKIKKAGYIPLAHGGQAWQEATMFDGVVLSVGGVDFYRKSMIELDSTALGSKTMEKVFDRMRQLRNLVDDNFPGRDWNLATAMVINGKAGMQIMGDWAKGEFINADKEPGVDFLCFRMPDTQEAISFNADQFVMFKVGETGMADQAELAKAIMSPSFQSAFNIVKGSVPARMDVSDEGFDDCGRKAIKDLKAAVKNNTLVGSFAHGHASPANVKNAMYDVITAHFNSQMSSAKAVKQLVKAVETAM